MDVSLPVSIAGAIAGLLSLWVSWHKTPSEIKKTGAETDKLKAETESIHAQVADHWAEHVSELQTEIKGLRIDVAQVRRENEQYRLDNYDLRDWAERLLAQFARHAPNIEPEPFICHNRKRSSEIWQPHTEE